MRVDALNKVSQLYHATSTQKSTKTEKTGRTDKYEISEFGKSYQIAKQAVSAKSDVREEKVNELKNSIASGTYNFNSEEVADKMVNRFFDSMA